MAVLLTLTAATGCLRLERPYPAVAAYALDALRPEGAPARPVRRDAVLKVRPLHVARMFDDKKFVYRRSGEKWATDYYNEFFILPGQMLTDIVERWLASSGAAGQVVPGSSQVAPTYVLEGSVQALYGDYSNPAQPIAVLAVEFLLLDERAAADIPRIVLHKTYRHEAPLKGKGPQVLVANWGEALKAVLTALEADLAAADLSRQ
jgi:cholesterol transport system auxiliary component